MKLKSFFSCCFRTWVVLLIGGFGLCSAAFGDAQYVTWSNIGLGYATAGTNTPSFRYSSLITEGNYQFAAYYEPDDGNNSNGVNDGVAVFARRTLGTDTWQTYRTSFKANTLSDGHDTISFGIDGDGVIHMSWGMHGDAFHYSKTAASVLNSDPITFGADLGTMTGGGNESGTTYPQFYRLPDGNLLYLFRTGGSGNGDTKINRYDTGSDTWSRVQTPLIDGYVSGGGYPSVNAYTNTMVLDAQGNLQLTWCWRTGSDSTCGFTDYQSNHNICYAKSSDQGATWKKMDNTAYTLPIWEGTAETVIPIPEGSSLINQTSMTVDKNNRPLLATWWAPGTAQGNYTRQYMLVYYDGSQWQTSQITNRPTESRQAEGKVGELGRPIVLTDQDGRVLVVMRYKERSNVVTVAYSSDRQNWTLLDLTTQNSGGYEPTYDPELWKRQGILDLFYQPVGLGQASSMVSALEWDALHWLRANITVDWAGGNTAGATNWGVTANWTNAALPPDGKWSKVRFGNQSSANSVVDMLTAGRTVGNLIFTASTGTTIQSSSGYALTLDNSGADSTISLAGTHTIAAQVLLNNDVDISGTGTLTLSSGVSGSYGMNILSGNVNASCIQLTHLYIGSGAKLSILPTTSEALGTDFSPVPEPNAWLLLAVGAWCAWGSGRWRKYR